MAATETGRRVALVLLDIERFRTINDSLGRQAGDHLLKLIAGRMGEHARKPSWLGRVGANEFAIFVPEVQSEDALRRRCDEGLQAAFGAPFAVGGRELRIAAKLGIALFPGDGQSAELLFRSAEAALRKAKQSGERYVFFEQRMTERVAENLKLENRLRQAVEQEEFVLHYQPKVELETRRIVGVEALIRWNSPELGMVPPGRFIPMLEDTGLILPVGAWALQRAAQDHRLWRECGLTPPRVAVNVSSLQLRQRDADFVDAVRRALACGSEPAGLDLEITESMIMTDIEDTIAKLEAVRALGVQIAVDDFGTGYSSLAYLAKLPVHALKIDRSFIVTMAQESTTMTLVATMVNLAHSLRLKVVAEGVDEDEQDKYLRLLRCDEAQGYLYGRPMPAERLAQMLEPLPAQPRAAGHTAQMPVAQSTTMR